MLTGTVTYIDDKYRKMFRGKKNMRHIFYVEIILSVLFWLSSRKKEPKTAFEKFRLCGGDLGRCPKSPQAFEKACAKLS